MLLEAMYGADERLFAALEGGDVQALSQSTYVPQYRYRLIRGLRNFERMVDLMTGSTNEHS